MKNTLSFMCSILMVFVAITANAQSVTFRVDMNGVSETFTTPEVNGTFNGWCGNCWAMSDADGDNIWEVSGDLAPGTYEYKFSADAWGIQESLDQTLSCVAVTIDGANVFVNRIVVVGDTDMVLDIAPWNGCAEGSTGGGVAGCLDANASNYNADATTQSYDQYGNPECIYASCADIPDAEGCIYVNAYAPYGPGFGPAECTLYGGTACTAAALGCLDANATNYDASAEEQLYDQYGNSSCVYASCTDVPEPGCIYADGFGVFNVEFGADQCIQYGGTPCTGDAVLGCTDSAATNYNAAATQDDGSCEYPTSSGLVITTTVCDGANSVSMTGPWWGWNPANGPVATDNGDGTWSFTFDPAPTDNMEYLLVVDGVQEDLVSAGTASNDWSCTPVTDNWSYANRLWTVGSGNVSNTYGTCGECEVSNDVPGCMDSNASNYNADATVQAMDQYGNIQCIYASCDDIPDAEGCIYSDAYSPFHENFSAVDCASYGGTPCTESSPETATVEFIVDMNGVDQPSADYPSVVVNGSWNGWNGWGVELADADADGIFTGSAEFAAGSSFEYVVAVTGPADGWSGWGMQWHEGCTGMNAMVTVGTSGTTTTSYFTAGCTVLGCTDSSASNYNASATDDDGSCVYPEPFSCDENAIYCETFDSADAVASFNQVADAASDAGNANFVDGAMELSVLHTNTAAGGAYIFEYVDGNAMYQNASSVTFSFDAKFSSAPYAAAIHLQTEFPGAGVSNSFDIQNQGINSDNFTTVSYTFENVAGDGILRFHFNVAVGPVENASVGLLIDNITVLVDEVSMDVSGCMDSNASNYNADATVQAMDQYGNIQCIYASCDDIPDAEGCIYSDAYSPFHENFSAVDCASYGGTPCTESSPETATVEFIVDMNGVDQPSADYPSVVVNGSWNGWNGWGVELADADADGIFTGSAEFAAGSSFEYVVAVTGPADGWSGWGMQWHEGCTGMNAMVTVGEAGSVTTSNFVAGCSVLGCTNPAASNYDASATQDDGSCIILGCTYAAASNYNPDANDDDGSCEGFSSANDCPYDTDNDGVVATSDLLGFLSAFGQMCE